MLFEYVGFFLPHNPSMAIRVTLCTEIRSIKGNWDYHTILHLTIR